MSFQEIYSGTVNRGERLETGATFTPGQVIAVANANFDYGQVQQWGVLLMKGEDDAPGGFPLIYDQLLLFHQAHAMYAQNWICKRMEVALYVPVTYSEPDIDIVVWIWEFGDS